MKKVFKKIIRFPVVIALAFWEVLKYVWENRKRLLVPFLLGEATYWAPFVGVCILSIIYNNYAWAAAFYGFYVGVLPAIPLQIICTFFYYGLFLKLSKKDGNGLKDECDKLIERIKKIT
jgi:hypothetical protein